MIKILHVTDSSYPSKGKSKMPDVLKDAHNKGLIDLKEIDISDEKYMIGSSNKVIISIDECNFYK